MKSQLNARISEATRRKLNSLTAIYGTQTEAIAVAIDRLWQDHNKEHRTMKASIVSKRIDSKNARLELRSGEKGSGGLLHAVTYWPDQQASVNAAYDLINAEANRLGVKLE